GGGYSLPACSGSGGGVDHPPARRSHPGRPRFIGEGSRPASVGNPADAPAALLPLDSKAMSTALGDLREVAQGSHRDGVGATAAVPGPIAQFANFVGAAVLQGTV